MLTLYCILREQESHMNVCMDGWILDKIRVLYMNEWIQFGRETSVSSVDKQVQMTVILKTREL